MSPFIPLVGSCVSAEGRNTFELIEGAHNGACMRRCWQSIDDSAEDPTVIAGRCVGYATSEAPHEGAHCSTWDALSHTGAAAAASDAADGHRDRRCSLVDPSLLRAGVVPPVEDARFAAYRARIASRVGASGLGAAPPAPPPDRWSLGVLA